MPGGRKPPIGVGGDSGAGRGFANPGAAVVDGIGRGAGGGAGRDAGAVNGATIAGLACGGAPAVVLALDFLATLRAALRLAVFAFFVAARIVPRLAAFDFKIFFFDDFRLPFALFAMFASSKFGYEK
jgi:hypothetical protein